jgi:hypothetical protein
MIGVLFFILLLGSLSMFSIVWSSPKTPKEALDEAKKIKLREQKLLRFCGISLLIVLVILLAMWLLK